MNPYLDLGSVRARRKPTGATRSRMKLESELMVAGSLALPRLLRIDDRKQLRIELM